MRHIATAVLLFMICISSQAEHPWENAKNETLLRQRYGNCDYGMFMLLPAGVVAHGTVPPNPNHGVTIRLPNMDSTSEIDITKAARYIWANAEYDTSDSSSRQGTVAFYINSFLEGKHGTVTKRSARLGSLPATRLKVIYQTRNGVVAEELIFTQRANIVYELGLRTRKTSYREDRSRFDKLSRGFQFSKLPKGECSN
jgi:hypothetical protein